MNHLDRMQSYRMLRATVAGAALVASAPAIAQSSASSPPSAAAPAGNQGADIVVTAQRRSQALSDVPVSITAVTGNTLAKAGITQIQQIGQIAPTVSFNEGYSERATSFTIRGISSTASEGGIQPSTAVVVDGVPLARQGEFISNFNDIQQVEVLAGPQGTLFGKNATAGVINITTNRPTDQLSMVGEGTVTTDQEYVGHVMLNIPVSNSIQTRFNAFYDNQKPFVKNIGPGPDAYGATSYGFMGKIKAELSPDLTLLLSGDYRHRKSSYGASILIVPNSGELGVLQTEARDNLSYARDVYKIDTDGANLSRSKGYSGAAQFDWQVADKINLTSISSYRVYDLDDLSDIDSTPYGVNIGTGFSPNPANYPIASVDSGFPRQPSHAKYFSQEVRGHYVDHIFDIVVGGFYQNYKEHLLGSNPLVMDGGFLGLGQPGVLYYVDQYKMNNHYFDRTVALFGDTTVNLTRKFGAFVGLRYTHEDVGANYHRDVFFNPVAGFFNPITTINSAPPAQTITYDRSKPTNNLSGRAGLTWKPTSGTNLYFTAARGYKGPAVDTSGSATGLVNPITKPEIATSFELGAKLKLIDNRLFLTVALYSEKIKDIQQTTNVPGTISTQLQNAGNIRSKGVEGQLDLTVTRQFRLSANLAYTDAHYQGGIVGCNATQTTTNTCPNFGGVAGTQSIDGDRAIETPVFKFNASAVYETEVPALDGKVTGRLDYMHQSSIQYQLTNDPLTRERPYGLLNASVGYTTDNDRLSVSVFARNLTNRTFFSNLVQADGFVGQSIAHYARDSKRYAGLTVRLAY